MKFLRNLLIASALLAGSTAHAVIIDFQAMADRTYADTDKNYGESAWQPLNSSIATEFGVDVKFQGWHDTDVVYAYLDSNTAGLGVCGTLNDINDANTKMFNGNNLCDPSSDDNVTMYERITIVAMEDIIIDGIWFNNNHDPDESLVGDTITIGGVDVTFDVGDIDGGVHPRDTNFLYSGPISGPISLLAGETLDIAYYMGDSYLTQLHGDQFYITKIDVRAVPEPGTLALLGAGLLGLGLTRRRRTS